MKANLIKRFPQNLLIVCLAFLGFLFIRYDLILKIPDNVYLTNEVPDSSLLNVMRDCPIEVGLNIEGTSVNDIWFTITSESELDYSSIEVCISGSDGSEMLKCFINPENVISFSDDLRTAVILLNFDQCYGSELPPDSYRVLFTNHSELMDEFDVQVKVEKSMPILNIGSQKRTAVGRYVAYAVLLLLITYIVIVFFTASCLDPAKYFLITGVFLGIIYMILCVAWGVPDTDSHYPAVYRFSNILLNHDEEWEYRMGDGKFLNLTGFSSRNSSVKDYALLEGAMYLQSEQGYMEGTPKEHMKFYSIVCYFPLVLGLCLGRILNLNPLATHYFARIFSLLFFIILCHHAIQTTPTGKWLFSLIPLLPVPLIFASSFSYDTMVLSISLNFISAVLRMDASLQSLERIGERKIIGKNYYGLIHNRYYINTIIWTFLLGAVKGGGYVVLFPIVLIFLQRHSKTYYIHHVLVLFCTVVVSLTLFDLILPSGMHLFQFGGEDSNYLSAKYALTNPYRFVMMTIKAYLVYFDFNLLNLGGMNLHYSLPAVQPTISLFIIIFLLFCCYLIGLFEKDEFSLEPLNKIYFLLVTDLTLCMVPVMLLSYTYVNSETVEGIQGRYFLPIFPIMFLCLTKFRMKMIIDQTSVSKYEIIPRTLRLFTGLSCINVYLILRICMLQ